MDDLQLGLIGVGVAVVLGVVVYNTLRSAKIRRTLPRVDVPTPVRREPGSGNHSSASVLMEEVQAEEASALESGQTGSVSVIDARIDCVVPLSLETPVTAEKVIPLMQRLRHAGSKPVWIEGQTEEGVWQAVQVGGRYCALRAAVQYANRSGPLNEVAFSEFVVGAQALADALDADFECPDMTETVARARELDAFAARCDRQLVLYLVAEGAPWAARSIQSVASQDGLTLARDGLGLIKRDAQQEPIFMLQFGATNFLQDDLNEKSGRVIQLLLDVPLANPSIQPFQTMLGYAQTLSQRIGARVVDEHHRPFIERAVDEIEAQLSVLYRTLNAAGIPAGSPVAQRLFSQ